VSAFVTFSNNYGIDLEKLAYVVRPVLPQRIINEAEKFWTNCVKEKKTLGLSHNVFVACDAIKRLWRNANPKIVEFWSIVESAVREVIADPTKTIPAGLCTIDKKGNWLRIKLPSGRYLCYAGATVEANKIKYLGVNQYSRKWGKLSTWGGRLVENIVQATARDILFYAMPEIESAGYEIVLHVHDELITETPDEDTYNEKELSRLMSKGFEWSKGLPLAAKGFETYRYRKD
jgi:DNA polymerase